MLLFIQNQNDGAYNQPPKETTLYLADAISQTFLKLNIAKPRASAVAYNHLPQRIFQSRDRENFCQKNMLLDITEPTDVLKNLSHAFNMSSFSSIFQGFNFSKFADDMFQYIQTFKLCTSDYRKYIKNKQDISEAMSTFAESSIQFGTFNFEKGAQVFTYIRVVNKLVFNTSPETVKDMFSLERLNQIPNYLIECFVI